MKKLILLLLFIPLVFSCSSGEEESEPLPIMKYILTTDVNTEYGGSVTPGGEFNDGTVVTISATAKTNWEFEGWLGDKIGTENPTQITMDRSKKVTALFRPINPFYLDDNGVTIKAIDGITAGVTGELNGVTYVAVSRDMLISKIRGGEDVSKVVTSLITNLNHPFVITGTDTEELFSKDFNQDISSWDVSNVTVMKMFFYYASSFNQDISKWDVSKVTDMTNLFNRARSFNIDISSWDVSNVTNMLQMFQGAYAFNQDISNWDVSKVTNMSYMFGDIGNNISPPRDDMDFYFTNFNQDISDWDVSNVTNMASMFQNNKTFNQDIGKWNTGKVEKMDYMFAGALEFNQDIGSWDTSKVKGDTNAGTTGMSAMFYSSKKFNKNLSKWCVTNITTLPGYFNSEGILNAEYFPVWGTCP